MDIIGAVTGQDAERSIEIETVNVRQAFFVVDGVDTATGYVEVVLRVSIIKDDLFKPVDFVENRVKQFVTDKIK